MDRRRSDTGRGQNSLLLLVLLLMTEELREAWCRAEVVAVAMDEVRLLLLLLCVAIRLHSAQHQRVFLSLLEGNHR